VVAPTETAPPSEWPGVEVLWRGGRRYLLVTLTDDADRRGVLAALKAHAVGLELQTVDVEAGELLFRVPSSLVWRSVVDVE
jgi:hypothetical protein